MAVIQRPRLRLLKSRKHAVAAEARHLERHGSPRLQMALIVAATGGIGFLASVLLLRAGIESMALRYPLCVAIAYVAFVCLLWCWLRLSARDFDGLDLSSGNVDVPRPNLGSAVEGVSYTPGGGGDFAGGGGGSTFDGMPNVSAVPVDGDVIALADGSQAAGDAASGGLDLDFGEIVFVFALIAFVFAIGWAAIGVISTAPVLLAELLVDAGLSGSLYRRIAGIEGPHWLRTAVERTLWRFGLVAVIAFGIGLVAHTYAPGTKTIGPAMRAIF